MSATLALIDLAGSIALLLWGLHMVESRAQRAFGPHLRRFLGHALGNRGRAFFAGKSVETSALHLDILRDLKRINAHIAAAAYPVLEKLGELLPSRLRREIETDALPPGTAVPAGL
jgi:Na+/phosphate symporter